MGLPVAVDAGRSARIHRGAGRIAGDSTAPSNASPRCRVGADCSGVAVRGNQMYDLHTAVLMREHGVSRICTRDTGFHRFPFLTVVDPLR